MESLFRGSLRLVGLFSFAALLVPSSAEAQDQSQFLVDDTVNFDFTPLVLSELEIDQYLRSEEWIDKAGAYSIQGKAMSFFIFISGCYSNIVGLPIPKLASIIKKTDISAPIPSTAASSNTIGTQTRFYKA